MAEKKFSIIAAVAQNNAIGLNNQLLWHIPEDFRYFKSVTLGHPVIMGKNTYLSLPKRPLPQRRNIVISHAENPEACEIARSVEEAMELAEKEIENFIIGGAAIYRQFFDKVQKLYITRILKDFEADTFFPEINLNEWELVSQEPQNETHKEGLKYYFEIYKRIK